MLYLQRVRTSLGNERKYLGWLRVSLGMITLGFVVERLDLLLARATGVPPARVSPALTWAPLLIFGIGVVTVGVATWEFFSDRKRITNEQSRGSRLLVALVLMILLAMGLIALLLALPATRPE